MIKYFNMKNIKKNKKSKKKISDGNKTLILMYDSSSLTLNTYPNGAIMLAIKRFIEEIIKDSYEPVDVC